jgi:RNA methyltransferase, TrmH family
MQDLISSHKNPKIKTILDLQKSSERKTRNLFVVEGLREIKLALEAGHKLHSIYICIDIIGNGRYEKLKELSGESIEEFRISRSVFEKIAYRENSDGVIALVANKIINLERLQLSENPLIIILEAIEKPGNIGAILRTADAANVDAVIICNPKTDIYNPNVIRSSVGCVFTNQVVASTTEEAIEWLKSKKIQMFATSLNTDLFYYKVDFKNPCALIMGAEDTGLSDKWYNADTTPIKIPMNGKIDSLNVSNATAIVVFEAIRQRNFR